MHFLNLEDVTRIHDFQSKLHECEPEVRDMAGLEAAVATPALTYAGEQLNRTVEEVAASYLIQIVNRMPFVSGNRAAGTAAALVFLYLNGYVVNAPEDVLAEFVLLVAQSKADKTDAVIFFREWVREIEA